MFGKLSLQAVSYDNPVVMVGIVLMLGGALATLLLLSYFRLWPYLWRTWLTSLDHKKIGVMYLALAVIMLLRGFADALMMRGQQFLSAGANPGFLSPEHYNQVFSAHGTIMVLFMAMPFLTGLMNIVVPLQLGKRDVAFPFMNSLSLWLTAAGAALMMVSLAIGEFSTAGWSGYPPYSELQFSPGVGVDYWIWVLMLSGAGSTMTGINFIVTILLDRAPGMGLMRMPLFSWTALCTSVLMALAFPALTVATGLLALDRYLGMHFFTADGGGNMMNFVNLFWIWGHPEVYILILPAFGIFSEVISTFSGNKLFGYRSLVYATVAITVLSFTVWLHHFFTMGASAGVNAAFGIATMIIAVPTGVKIYDWLLTLYRGRIRLASPMLWALAFLPTFAIGGATGVLLAVPPVDFMVHNSEFLVAHFHNMLIPGALFGYLAGYSYWFPKVFGFRLDETWGKLAFWNWLVGFYLAFMPLYVLGLMGMPRRMQHYQNLEWQPLLTVAAVGAGFIAIGIACLGVQLLVSILKRQSYRDYTGDPWHGRSLEWSTTSPPPVYNFAVPPQVTSVDAFWDRKAQPPAIPPANQYEAIDLPKNSSGGVVFGGSSLILGFALVWHIGWLAAIAGLAMLAVVIRRGFDDQTEYQLSATQIRQIEDRILSPNSKPIAQNSSTPSQRVQP